MASDAKNPNSKRKKRTFTDLIREQLSRLRFSKFHNATSMTDRPMYRSVLVSALNQWRNDGVAAASSDGAPLVVGGPDSSRVLSE